MMKKNIKKFKKDYKRHLRKMKRPSGQPYLENYKCYKPDPRQAAWVIAKVLEMFECDCSFRYFIYNIMGYGYDAYTPLYLAGGMTLTNGEFKKEE